jgi:hypothetical protein
MHRIKHVASFVSKGKTVYKVHHLHIIYDIIIQYIMYIVHVDDIIELITWTKLRSEVL